MAVNRCTCPPRRCDLSNTPAVPPTPTKAGGVAIWLARTPRRATECFSIAAKRAQANIVLRAAGEGRGCGDARRRRATLLFQAWRLRVRGLDAWPIVEQDGVGCEARVAGFRTTLRTHMLFHIVCWSTFLHLITVSVAIGPTSLSDLASSSALLISRRDDRGRWHF